VPSLALFLNRFVLVTVNIALPLFSGHVVKIVTPVSRTQKGSCNPVLSAFVCDYNKFQYIQR